jgi:hypothetical protein
MVTILPLHGMYDEVSPSSPTSMHPWKIAILTSQELGMVVAGWAQMGALTLKFLETKNWSIADWAACVKKNNFFSIFTFKRVNYIFHKLSVNTKHAQF